VENLGCADEGDLAGVDPLGQRAAAARASSSPAAKIVLNVAARTA
jgi:hypothetical protein